MGIRVRQVAALLFGSGMCALIYQVVWLREFRLVFGASTAASAAVLAIFMGGLGLGGVLLGPRADRHPRPLAFYAGLELLIAASAALTPFLVEGARALYFALGGSVTLGAAPATLIRLGLSAAVLAVPTILMGGTLPAAARAVETDEDAGRRHLALLYGANALGAVTGVLVATFALLALLGARQSLWVACLCNLVVAIAARSLARDAGTKALDPPADASGAPAPGASASGAPAGYVLAAAGATGFAFLLMELVWYRMLGPLLGGSTFTFGLILGMVLFGIGAGGVAYALADRRASPTLDRFALTLGVEAVCIAIPFALGDRLAILAAQLRALGAFGFYGDVAGWAVIAGLAALPAAFVSGVQFPLLLGLLGKGGRAVGKQTGLAYAWNTGGAILGALAGGFGILPLLTAPGAWRAVVVLLVLFGASALLLASRSERRASRLAPAGGALALALLLLLADGPTAAWRHSPIGAGRVELFQSTRNATREWIHEQRRAVRWEAEGVESSVAIASNAGLSFVVNGKVDGHAISDASTQVMLGLVGGVLHPRPRHALVVGLGTGSSAGWLADIPTMERVDVVELEPAILEVARRCAPVNRDVLAHPRAKVIIGDAREVLMTTPTRYDLIASEPSNPYRAGIASLYTREFYRAVAARLQDGGLFLQWIQAYEVDTRTVQMIYGTLATVFPVIHTWQTNPGDLLLVCAREPFPLPVPFLRERVQQEPFRSALAASWRTADLEGFLAHYVARPEFARTAGLSDEPDINTDDRMLVEYGFAGSVGRRQAFTIEDLRRTARRFGQQRPPVTGGPVNWNLVESEHVLMFALGAYDVPPLDQIDPAQHPCAQAVAAFGRRDLSAVMDAARRGVLPLSSPQARAMAARAAAETGAETAMPLIEGLRRERPVEGDIVLAHLRWQQNRASDAADALAAAFERCRRDPWAAGLLLDRALRLAPRLAAREPSLAPRLYAAVKEPFVLRMLDEERMRAAVAVASFIDDGRTAEAIGAFEPFVPWETEFLILRARCYRDVAHPLADRATAELATHLKDASVKLSDVLVHDPDEAARSGQGEH